MKREAARTRQGNKYDRKCHQLSGQEVEERLGRGEQHTVRFLLTPHPEPWQDLVYGAVTHDVYQLEGDPIILKSDGFPTYHLASVVDDHLMEISHVLRGVEWQASTPKHLLLYRALEWRPPHFGHLPLLVNSDGTKLSKRQGDMHIERLVTAGFFPEAVTTFVSLVGGGFEDREYSVDDCVSLNRWAGPGLEDWLLFTVSLISSWPGCHRCSSWTRSTLAAAGSRWTASTPSTGAASRCTPEMETSI